MKNSTEKLDAINKWIAYFAAFGYPSTTYLDSGMEGMVFALDGETVGKVWHRGNADDLDKLMHFYNDLALADLPFDTPKILSMTWKDDKHITVEKRLLGETLQSYLKEEDAKASDTAIECITTVLEELRKVRPTISMKKLSVINERDPLWANDSWCDSICLLLERKVALFGAQLREKVPNFDGIFDAVLSNLRTIDHVDVCAIHGDLCSANILVNESGVLTGVLDFGFLTTAGDPAFDASIAAGIYNMYGPHARTVDDALMAFLSDRFHYPMERLLTYRAAYAIASSNAYDTLGQDGHFAWSVATLCREDLANALGKA